MDHELFDSRVVNSVDTKDVSILLDLIRYLGFSPEQAKDEATDRLDLIGLEFDAEPFVHFLDWYSAVDDVRTIISLLDSGALWFRIEFVSNIADNLFEDILDSHDSLEDTPFVDDDSDLSTTVCLKLGENRVDPSRFRNDEDVDVAVAGSSGAAERAASTMADEAQSSFMQLDGLGTDESGTAYPAATAKVAYYACVVIASWSVTFGGLG